MPYYSIAAQLLVHAILYRYSAWQIGELPQVANAGPPPPCPHSWQAHGQAWPDTIVQTPYRYIAAQHSRSHLVFHYLFTLYSFLYCTLLAAIPCSMGRTRVRPTPTPSWFNDELPNFAMHPEEIEGATKPNSLKVNDELSYIAGWHIAAIGTPPNYFFDDAILFHCSTAAGSCYPLQIQCIRHLRAVSGGECRSTSSLPTFLSSSRPNLSDSM